MERKICANCKHYYRITGTTPQGSSFCRRVKNIINGGSTPCHYARYDQELCGIEARLFEQKEETPPPAKKKSFFEKLFGNRRPAEDALKAELERLKAALKRIAYYRNLNPHMKATKFPVDVESELRNFYCTMGDIAMQALGKDNNVPAKESEVKDE